MSRLGGSQVAGPESPLEPLVEPSTGIRLSGSLAICLRLLSLHRDAPICQSYDRGMTWSIWTSAAFDLVQSIVLPVYGSYRVMETMTQLDPSRYLTPRPSRLSRSLRVSQP